MASASEMFMLKVVNDAHPDWEVEPIEEEGVIVGFTANGFDLEECCESLKLTAEFQQVVGIDPTNLGEILDKVLAFILGLLGGLQDFNICVAEMEVDGVTVKGGPVSEKVLADRTVNFLREPTRLQRARIMADLKRDLAGTEADAAELTYSSFRIGGDPTNEEEVRLMVHENVSVPDFGYV